MRRKFYNKNEYKDLVGKQFGHWEVLSFSYMHKIKRSAYFACRCNGCGKVYDVRSDSLQRGESTKCKSCAKKLLRYDGYANIV